MLLLYKKKNLYFYLLKLKDKDPLNIITKSLVTKRSIKKTRKRRRNTLKNKNNSNVLKNKRINKNFIKWCKFTFFKRGILKKSWIFFKKGKRHQYTFPPQLKINRWILFQKYQNNIKLYKYRPIFRALKNLNMSLYYLNIYRYFYFRKKLNLNKILHAKNVKHNFFILTRFVWLHDIYKVKYIRKFLKRRFKRIKRRIKKGRKFYYKVRRNFFKNFVNSKNLAVFQKYNKATLKILSLSYTNSLFYLNRNKYYSNNVRNNIYFLKFNLKNLKNFQIKIKFRKLFFGTFYFLYFYKFNRYLSRKKLSKFINILFLKKKLRLLQKNILIYINTLNTKRILRFSYKRGFKKFYNYLHFFHLKNLNNFYKYYLARGSIQTISNINIKTFLTTQIKSKRQKKKIFLCRVERIKNDYFTQFLKARKKKKFFMYFKKLLLFKSIFFSRYGGNNLHAYFIKKRKLQYFYGNGKISYKLKNYSRISKITKHLEFLLLSVVLRLFRCHSSIFALKIIKKGGIFINGSIVTMQKCQIKQGDLISIKIRYLLSNLKYFSFTPYGFFLHFQTPWKYSYFSIVNFKIFSGIFYRIWNFALFSFGNKLFSKKWLSFFIFFVK